ncbi:MAG: polysaccharide deacetylase family protein [Acidobacteria bacterium]|nr:polysaccharide deacetylase family protein [Acidobacteriota bacterium]
MKFIKKSFKRRILSILAHPSFKVLHRVYTGIGSCLLYHRVTTESKVPMPPNPSINITLPVTEFEQQIAYISKHYNCVALPEAVERLAEGTLSNRTIVVTFDDGYRDNLLHALPVLERHGVPATIFVATGLIDGTCVPWWYELEALLYRLDALEVSWKERSFVWKLETPAQRYAAISELSSLFREMSIDDQNAFMEKVRKLCPSKFTFESEFLSWDELIKLDRHPLITIGAHTKNHPVLSRATAAELGEELAGGKEILKNRLGHSVDHLAYPFGGSSEVGRREFEAARDAGFRSAFTTRFGHLHAMHRKFLHSLPRIIIDYGDTISRFKQKLAGIDSMIRYRGKRAIVD